MGSYLGLIGFLFVVLNGYSQNFDAVTWAHIDSSIEKKRILSEINVLVQQLKQKAFAQKKYFHAARCCYYQIIIADQRTDGLILPIKQ